MFIRELVKLKIYGKSVVREAIRANRRIQELYVDETFLKKEVKFIDFLKDKNIKFIILPNKEFEKRFVGNAQGVGAIVEDYTYYNLEDVVDKNKKQYFLILDGLEDPQNLGAILRTADATNLDGIIIPKNHSVSLNATVAKVSVGAIEYAKVIQVSNINTAIAYLKENCFWIVGTKMDADKSYKDLDADVSLAIIIGSEGFGMSKLVAKNCDYTVSIPMSGHVNSLNASVSAALLMYEIYHKRNK